MIASEILAEKLQEILGTQYKCVAFHDYLTNYTQPLETQMGTQYDMDYQAFEIDKGVIPCVVKCTEALPNSAPYDFKSLDYELTFSVPLNIIKKDKKGRLLEKPEFDFFNDYNNLVKATKFKELSFISQEIKKDSLTMGVMDYYIENIGTNIITISHSKITPVLIDTVTETKFRYSVSNADEKSNADTYYYHLNEIDEAFAALFYVRLALQDLPLPEANIWDRLDAYFNEYGDIRFAWEQITETIDYKGRMTVAEPQAMGIEDRNQSRMIWTVRGKLELYAADIKTGQEYKISIDNGSGYKEIINPSNIRIDADREANAIQSSTELKNELYTTTKAHTVAFNIDDIGTGAVEIFRDIVVNNTDFISSGGTKRQNRQLKVKLENDDLSNEFYATVGVTYNAATIANVGSFSVTLTNDYME